MVDSVNSANERFNDILERCIQAVSSGQASVEECIARFPEYPELGDLLRLSAAFEDLPRPPMPAAFTAKTQQRLQSQFRERMRAARPVRGPRFLQGWPTLWRALAVVAVVLIVVLGSGFVLVHAAADTAPTELLYFLKRANERVELRFANAQSLPGVQYAIAEARIFEINKMARRTQPIDTAFLEETFNSISDAHSSQTDESLRKKLSVDALNAVAYAQASNSLAANVAQPLLTRMEVAFGYHFQNGQPQPITPTPAVVAQTDATPTQTPSATFTVTATGTQTVRPTQTFTVSPTPTSSPTRAATRITPPTKRPSNTPKPGTSASPLAATFTPSPTTTATVPPSPTLGQGPAVIMTGVPATAQPTESSATATASPTVTDTLESTAGGTSEGTVEATAATSTPTSTDTATVESSPTDTSTPTSTPTSTVTLSPTATLTLTPSRTRRPTRAPTHTNTPTPLPPPTATPTIAPTATPNGLPSANFQQPAQEITFQNCPPQGDGGDATLNQVKNRVDEGNYQQVTFDALANLPWPKDAQGKTRDQWAQPVKDEVARSEGLPVIVEGYIVKVQENQPEAQNCHSNDYKTWQLWLLGSAGSANDAPKAILVGVSPRVRANHNGWTLDKLNALAGSGTKIRVSGWLMYNQDHPDDIGKVHLTPWEIHPAMQIAISKGDQWVNLDDYKP